MSSLHSLLHRDYTVGWICALPVELTAAMATLDEKHQQLPQHPHDDNLYTLGRIGEHNVVIAGLPAGQMGNNSAATVAAMMRYSFGDIRFGLMVGIGGGVPSEEHDIRLGDVVVSKPNKQSSGVIQYDFGQTVAKGQFIHNGSLNAPPSILLNAVTILQAGHNLYGNQLAQRLSVMKTARLKEYTYQGTDNDNLFEAEYDHIGNATTCHQCDRSRLILRPTRDRTEPVVHYGSIASGNQVMKDGVTRDQLRQESDVLCFEMEAAGLMNTFPCLVIRGICDYADSHKNKQWQPYAAATAAAYAKELLYIIPGSQVMSVQTVNEVNDFVAPSSPAKPAITVQRDQDFIAKLPGNYSPVTALSRYPDRLDLFVCGNDGLIYTAWWHEGSPWSRWKCLGAIALPPRAYITTVARKPDKLALFACAKDGQVYTTEWSKGSGWSHFWQCLGGKFPSGSKVTAVAREPDHLDLFACGINGSVYTCKWSVKENWSSSKGKWEFLGGRGLARASVAAVARRPDQLDLFVCGSNGRVYTKWWSENSGWSEGWKSLGGSFPEGANISAVARESNQLDLFACGTDGRVYTCWWKDNHTGWSGISQGWQCLGGRLLPGSYVSAVARKPEQLDIFVCGGNGHVYTCWWGKGKGWLKDWKNIGGEVPSGAVVACVARKEDSLDLFSWNQKGHICTSFWEKGHGWSGRNGWDNLGQVPSEDGNR